MRKFCWVYMEKSTGDLWLCMRPHRRACQARWQFIRDPDDFDVVSFREMLDKYSYVGRF